MPRSKSQARPGKRSPFVIYLRQLLDRTGMDLTELGRRAQLSRVTVSRHVNGHAFPHYGNRKRYAAAFGMKIDEFEAGWRQPAIAGAAVASMSSATSRRGGSSGGVLAASEEKPGPELDRPARKRGVVIPSRWPAHAPMVDDGSSQGIPLLGEVAASGFVESLVFDLSEPERLPIACPGLQRVYALRIRGESMMPLYQPGELLILQDIPPAEIVDSEDAVVQCDGSFDGQSTFKRVLVMGNQRLRLMPLNSRYESLECSWDAVVRVGRVLGKYTPASQIRGI